MKDSLVKYFENLWGKAKFDRKQEILELLEKVPPNATVLDCGCDDGSFTEAIAKRIRAENLYGIEINKKSALQARKKGIKVKISDLNRKFPFKANSFDVIVADQVIEHLWDLDNFVSEVYRVLKQTGMAVVSTENLASWHNIIALIAGLQPFSGPTPSKKRVLGYHPLIPSTRSDMPVHAKVLTLRALKSLFRSYGFDINRVSVHGYFPFPHYLSKLLTKLDNGHAFFITIKVSKRKQ